MLFQEIGALLQMSWIYAGHEGARGSGGTERGPAMR